MPLPVFDIGRLRDNQQRVKVYGSFFVPTVIGTARVDGAHDRGEQTLTLTDISLDGAYTDFHDQPITVWVGTSLHAFDVDKVRLKRIDGSTMILGGNSVVWADGQYITFTNEFKIWSAFPRIAPDETFYKDFVDDGGIAYTDQNEVLGPVAMGGPHAARFLESGTAVFQIPAVQSYSMNGDSITSVGVTTYPSTGVTVGAEVDGIIPITYTLPGVYVVRIVATNTAGKTQTTWRYHFVHEDDPNSAHYPHVGFDNLTVRGDWNSGGWGAELSFQSGASLLEIPDGTLAVIWYQQQYASVEGHFEPSIFPIYSGALTVGYVTKDSTQQNVGEGGETSINVVTAESMIKNNFMFSISLAAVSEPSKWYEHREDMTIGRIVYHILKWHSTIFETTDVFFLMSPPNDILRKYSELEKGNLYNMVDNMVQNNGNRTHLICNKLGRLHLSPDLLLQDDSVRNAATTIMEIDAIDVYEPITIVRNHQPEIAFVFTSGFNYNGDAETDPTPLGSTAPSEWPYPVGSQDVNLEKQSFADQNQANEVAGQVFAVRNRLNVEMRIEFQGNYIGALDPSQPEWFEITIDASENPRGIQLTAQHILCRQVTANVDVGTGIINTSGVFDIEVDGIPGVPYDWPDEVPDFEPPDPDPIPDDDGIGDLYSVTSLRRLPDYGDSWTTLQADNMNDGRGDPHTSAVIFVCKDGSIERSVNAGVSFTEITLDDPPNDAGDSPAPTVEDLTFEQYEPNWAVAGQHIFMATWQNDTDDWRTWLLITEDDGDNWVWQSVVSEGSGTTFTYEDTSGSLPAYTEGTSDQKCLQQCGDFWVRIGRRSLGEPYVFILDADGIETDLSHLQILDESSTLIDAPNGDIALAVLRDGLFVVAYSNKEDVGLGGIFNTLVSAYELDGSGIATHMDTIRLQPTGRDYPVDRLIGVGAVAISRLSDTDAILVSSSFAEQLDSLDIEGAVLRLHYDDLTDELSVVDTERLSNAYWAVSLDVFDVDEGRFHAYLADFNGSDHTNDLFSVCNISAVAGVDIISEEVISTASAYHHISYTALSTDGTGIISYINFRPASSGSDDGIAYCQVVRCTPAGIFSGGTAVALSTDVSQDFAIGITFGTGSCKKAANQALIAYGFVISQTFSCTQRYVAYRTVTVSELVASLGSEIEMSDYNATYPIIADGAISFRDACDTNKLVIRGIGGEVQLRGLGISSSFYNGDRLYVTAWNPSSQLELLNYELPSLSQLFVAQLGGATEANVDDRLFWAYPYTVSGDDDSLVVIGRMADPGGLGLSHIIGSINGGVDFDQMEDSWGTDHAGAIIEIGTTLYVIRNSAGVPTLYQLIYGGTPDFVSNLSPLTGFINPRAFCQDNFGDLCAGAADPQSPIIMSAEQPDFTLWRNISFNHATTRGVRSLFVLQ